MSKVPRGEKEPAVKFNPDFYYIAPKIFCGAAEYIEIKKSDRKKLEIEFQSHKQLNEMCPGEVVPIFDFDPVYNTKAEQEEKMKDDFLMFLHTVLLIFKNEEPDIYMFECCGKKGDKYTNSVRIIVRNVGKFPSLKAVEKFYDLPKIKESIDALDLNIYKGSGMQQKIRLPYQFKTDYDKRMFQKVVFKPDDDLKKAVLQEKRLPQFKSLNDFYQAIKGDHVSNWMASNVSYETLRVKAEKPAKVKAEKFTGKIKTERSKPKEAKETKQKETKKKETKQKEIKVKEVKVKETKKKEPKKKEVEKKSKSKSKKVAASSDDESDSDTDHKIRVPKVEKSDESDDDVEISDEEKSEASESEKSDKSDKEDDDEDSDDDGEESAIYQTDVKLKDVQFILPLAYPPKYVKGYDEYRECVRFCVAFCHGLKTKVELETMRELCETVCKAAPGKFEMADFNRKWAEPLPADDKKIIKVGTLMKRFKENNAKEYEKWLKKKAKENPEKFLLKSPMDSSDIADYFLLKWSGQFIMLYEKIYNFNESSGLWVKNAGSESIYNRISDDTFMACKDAIGKSENAVAQLKKIAALRKNSNIKAAIEAIKNKIVILESPFDKNVNLIGFENGVYDLEKMEFRKGRAEDYVSMSTGYNFIDPAKLNDEDKKDFYERRTFFEEKFLRGMFPVDEEYRFSMKTFSATLCGEQKQNLVFVTGGGRNGKDTLIEKMMRRVLGKYYYKADVEVLQTKRRGLGPCPEIANMDMKRAIIYTEPEKDSGLLVSVVKAMTGTEIISGRGLQDGNTEKQASMIQFLLCNDIPLMKKCDWATKNRLVNIIMRSTFVNPDQLSEYAGNPLVFPKNPMFESSKWQKKNCDVFIHILLDYFRIFNSEGRLLQGMPAAFRAEIDKYVLACDGVASWVFDNYKKQTPEDELKDDKKFGYFTRNAANKRVIKMKDIHDKFKLSDIYQNSTKAERKEYTFAKFREELMKHNAIKCDFKEGNTNIIARSSSNGVETETDTVATSALIGWMQKPKEESDS